MKKYKHQKTFTFDGKRYVVRADTEPQLYEKLALKKRDLEEGRVTISGSMTVSEWVKQCMEAYKPNVGDDYRYQMEQRIQKHVLSDIGSLPLKSIKPLQCQAILNRQKGMSKSHINKLYHELYFIFDKAVSNQLILKNPAGNLIRPEGYVNTRRSLTPQEEKAWIEIMDTDDRFILFQLMYYCGCRSSEAIKVTSSDFFLKSYPALHIRGTKTKNSDRVVPVPDTLWAKINTREGVIAVNSSGRPFTHTSYHRLSNALKRALNIAMGCQIYRNQLIPPLPLGEDFVPYMFRHTYCTNLQKAGVDIRTARDLMGHADISTTANIYTHQDDTTLETAARLIGCHTGCHI